MIEIAPSILAADFLHLGRAVSEAEAGGAERLQIDVMDGRFVPNLTIGPDVVAAIRTSTHLVLEAHLMIVEPERFVPAFADAGADIIIVHQEVSPHLFRTLQQIRDRGKRAGVALNPATPWSTLEDVFELIDLVLVMTVNPGFGGQRFIPEMLPKIRRLRGELDERGSSADLEVDGGIGVETARHAAEAGARVLVAGTSVYQAADGVSKGIRMVRAAAEEGLRA